MTLRWNELSLISRKRGSELGFNKEAVRVVTGLLSIGFTYQQMLNLADLAWFLQSINVNLQSLQADVNKYGSFKKALEVLDQKSRNLESQKKGYLVGPPGQVKTLFLEWILETFGDKKTFFTVGGNATD
jgi:hypothetical protein